MWPFSKKRRVPESVALSIVGAASLALHAGWISYVLAVRSDVVRSFFEMRAPFGLAGGLHLFTASVFLVFVGLGVALFKGKDCSEYRDHVFWFFLASIVMYLLMTVPGIAQFSLTPNTV
jgi:hypothetical protein